MRCRVIWASSERETPSMPKVKLACSIGLSCPIEASISTNSAAFSGVSLSSSASTPEAL